MKTLLHVDMDAFFASVEQLDHPEWRGKPVIVGSGPHERGVVSTCSYEARRFGVHSAMPSRTAYEHCPQAIFTRPNMARYQEVSDCAFEVFGHYSPFVEGVSIDEAFLDITGNIHHYGSARALGEALRAEVKRVCGVTCSVGIAPNRLLAKIGSEQHKPNGLTMMPFAPDEIAAFLRDKPIGILWGVGKATLESLRPYGITTCGDVQRMGFPKDLVDLAFGRCEDTVYWQPADEKSVSREYTFGEDEVDRSKVRQELLELVADVGMRFRRVSRWATTARVKFRDAGFHTFTRQMPFPSPARDDIAFREAALALFDREEFGAIRLIGFGVTGFVNSPELGAQLELFANPRDAVREKRERLSATIDILREQGSMIKAFLIFLVSISLAIDIASANTYTNLAGNVVQGSPMMATPLTVSLINGKEKLVYQWSIFPEKEQRRLAADAGSTQFVPLKVRLAIDGVRKAIKRSQQRAEKRLCTKEQSEAFCKREYERMNAYLMREVSEGHLLPCELSLLQLR